MKKYTEIDGWFNYSKTFDFLVSKVQDGGTFVECGAWLGKSSSYLCDIAQNRVNIFIVDNWQGSKNELNSTQKLALEDNVYEIFLENMGNRKYIPIKSDGKEAATKFENNSCDVVFIDMEHTYDAVKSDIISWLPKVKNGGFIAGHDYTDDWIGVKQAVNELFPIKNLIFMDTCWIFNKQETI